MPKAKTVPTVEDKPFVVTRLPYGDPVYKAKFDQARAEVRKDLVGFREDARRYCDWAMDAQVDDLFVQLDRLSPWDRRPQRVEGRLDGLIGITYCAEIRLREEF